MNLDAGYRCVTCGASGGVFPLGCPGRGAADGADHVLAPLPRTHLPAPDRLEPSPFLRYRHRLTWYRLGRQGGMKDAALLALGRRLDDAVAEVDGQGFRVTPARLSDAFSAALGARIWLKDETGNVSGSHKARHLMGVALCLQVLEHLGGPIPGRLAIASCGNAALAAAVLARALGRDLDVFLPEDAEPAVVDRLRALGASIQVCPRSPGVPGDPCYAAFRAAAAGGAVPFCCQGPDCGVTVEGGSTLTWELLDSATESNAPLDRLLVQVGGGALASSAARALGASGSPARIHPVQARVCPPLARAWDCVVDRVYAGLGEDRPRDPAAAARRVQRASGALTAAMAWARRDRAAVMWPWEPALPSLAHGILDDETYDWAEVVEATLKCGGWPVVVEEPVLDEAVGLVRSLEGVRSSATGSAGLAGALALARSGAVPPGETWGVILSGVDRAAQG